MLQRALSYPLAIALTAIAVGSGIDALVKAIAPEAGLHHLIAWRFTFGGLIALAVFRARKLPRPSADATRFHTLRGTVQLAAAFLFFYALMHLPLAEATIIGFTAALMVAPIARVLLGEAISPLAVISTCIGFGGAALAVSAAPEQVVVSDQRGLALVACFGAAFLYALVLILLRMRAKDEDAITIVMFTNVVPALLCLPITLGLFGAPNWGDLKWFFMFGVLGFGTWLLMTLAYARAPAQRLAPMEYTALIWSGLFGAVFFNEFPGWQMWAGGAIIIAACLIVAFESHFATRKAAKLPASDIPE